MFCRTARAVGESVRGGKDSVVRVWGKGLVAGPAEGSPEQLRAPGKERL